VNACQAMPNGGEIKISATSEPKHTPGVRLGDGKVIVTVEDTGPGIPKEQLPHIFEPFYTTKSSGTGLGLYVVKQLVEKNGGRIKVQSQSGVGTTFVLFFPQ